MSTERHGSKYKPKHRHKRKNKQQRPKKGPNRGSKFDGQHVRRGRLRKEWLASKEYEGRDYGDENDTLPEGSSQK